MEITELLRSYAVSPQVGALAKLVADKHTHNVLIDGLQASATPMMFAAVASKQKTTMLFVLNDADEAGYFYHDLIQLLGDGNVLFFPSSYRRAIKYAQRDSASEILRTEVLARIANNNGDSLLVVTHPEAIAEMVVSKRQLDERTLHLEVGQTIKTSSIENTLNEFGFKEVDYVYEPGQYAARGSILDVYSFSSELPFRLDFFGDDIESIRTFEVETQLSSDKRQSIDIMPELANVAEDKVSFLSFLPKDTVVAMKDFDFVRDTIERTYDEGFSEQALLSFSEGSFSEELGVRSEELNASSSAPLTSKTNNSSLLTPHSSLKKHSSLLTPHSSLKKALLTTVDQYLRDITAFRLFNIGHRTKGTPDATLHFSISPQPLFHKNFELLKKSLEDYRLRGYQIFILADSQKQIERLKEILTPTPQAPHVGGCSSPQGAKFATEGIDSQTHKMAISKQEVNGQQAKHTSSQSDEPKPPTWGGGGSSSFIGIGGSCLHSGFADDTLKVCIFTDHQIFDRFHKYNLRSDKARSGKVSLTLKEIKQFEVGDYVVHVDHGIGKFGGLIRMPQGDSYQEMIKILYSKGDAIYVSIHSLYKVSKYKAQDNGEPPRLSHLGTGQWENLKERTKKKIKDIARDLIKLYAARRHERGFAFSHDSYLQHELEASFLYEDTPDQLKATNDVKADMEKARPMDRLVCGDVGFGKTEVAVRAAFKAACDSKQVAVLVPTTVLAYQHYHTFSSRLKDMPVRVEYLSRARSPKKTREILADLEAGKIDIIIGTHKLIGKTVKFHDLGLLIIDEEQKFGVATKEKLRKVKVNVDTLTMSATPIPRTLQFSLVGARDLSIIQTPPPNRYPIQTEIHTFGPEIIADAINFEMSRNGQVYFVNNRISDLQHIASVIHSKVPDARVAIGHGQMKPEELEQVILDFANYDYDVLLSTTIVENGIDIPNANTIIINGAQNFGLSDLHQMRGRVGRGNRKAFCYLLAPPLSALNPESRRRLEALENFSDLGSGINIAMQDLDIRGAGNLLGAEQSGFIADLGYETYQKILTQAVTELKNDEFADLYAQDMKTKGEDAGVFVDDCAFESDLEMYFPDLYVPSDSERMLLYRELDSLKSEEELEAYKSRLRDRFGDIPAVANELMWVVPLRWLGKSMGCEKIMLKQGKMTLFFVSNPNSAYYQSQAFDNVLNYITQHPRECNLREANGKRSMVISDVVNVEQGVDILKSITKIDG